MIPRHRPPFGPMTLLAAGARTLVRTVAVEDLERAYEARLGIEHAIWLPSARYGITRSIQIACSDDVTVVCPVFNCGAVFHAARETLREVRFVDTAEHSFLMDLHEAPAAEGSAVILSEMFGHRFDELRLRNSAVSAAAIRVFDLAMGIPTPGDMQRMQQNDVTVASFGIGKSLYAGWGGMAFTKSDDMAAQLRQRRSNDLSKMNLRQRVSTWARMAARTIAHEPAVYKHLRSRPDQPPSSSANSSSAFSPETHEWRRPWNQLHLQLAFRNFAALDQTIEKRNRLAKVYRTELAEVIGDQTAMAETHDALSHFSVRVPAERRNAIRQTLWDAGYDVGTLFPFPTHLANVDQFPHAACAAAEILNLPLSCQLTAADVQGIARIVRTELVEHRNHKRAA